MQLASVKRLYLQIAEQLSEMIHSAQIAVGLRNRSETSAAFHAKLRERGSQPILADHQAIFDALQRKQPLQARKAMQQHLRRLMDEFSDFALN